MQDKALWNIYIDIVQFIQVHVIHRHSLSYV